MRLPVVALLPLLSSCALFTLASKKASWPVEEGEVALAGLDGPVTVTFDARGVPHVDATTEHDAWFAVGALHARDRLFQLDLQRRAASGGLSGLLGEGAAQVDVFTKAWRVRERADALLANARPEARAAMQAYADGINAQVATLDQLPVEFRLLDLPFDPWKPGDSMAVVTNMSWDLQTNADEEIAAWALRDLPTDTLQALLQGNPPGPDLDPYWDALKTAKVGPWTPEFAAWEGAFLGAADPQASNNWVVGPSRSADAAPIVANDPHLSQRVPSLWYFVDLHGGDLHVAGATMPGAPMVLSGHTETFAWGVTNVMADYVDLAVLERQGDQVVVEGQPQAIEWREVTVTPRKAKEPVVARVPWTSIGPVLTDPTQGDHVMVLRWHAFDPSDDSVGAFYGLNVATTVDDGLAAAARPSMVSQNIVMADADGRIAWRASGSLIERRAHTGRLPYPGSDPEHGWAGFREQHPTIVDPEVGYLLTANHVAPAGGEDLSTRFSAPWRHDRIDEVLGSRDTHTAEQMRALQLDRRDGEAVAVLDDWLEGVSPSTPGAERCHAALTSWDKVASKEAVGPLVWAAFRRELLRVALEDELTEEQVRRYLALQATRGALLADGRLDRFLDDRAAAVDEALKRACVDLEARYGDRDGWAWGRAHQLKLQHPFASSNALLKNWNLPEIDYGGSYATVNAASYRPHKDDWKVSSMASMRLVIPLSDVSKTTFANPGGPSGHPGHPQNRTGWPDWTTDQQAVLGWKGEGVRADRVLTLQPAD